MTRLLERGLDQRDEIERIRVALAVEQLERCQQKRRKRLVKSKPFGYFTLHVPLVSHAVRTRLVRHQARRLERREHLVGAPMQRLFLLVGLKRYVDQLVRARKRIATLLHLGKRDGMRHFHTRTQRFGNGVNQAPIVILIPPDESLRRF